ncbi:hypothetical protein DPMN_097087 [Dreissena polymorpha]|uniref:Uncharacterized protein n=1 Tax=Dreissena polymorpha TaxID=45954 RepID=A0A9D4LB18_DREPO|nr:hypothetical protein DPMN_097087 [Dreissena polymorpha]
MEDIGAAEEIINFRKLDKVMEDIGVTEEVIRYRRHVHFLLETNISIMEKEVVVRIFGSQSEGSTKLGNYLKRLIAILPSYCGEILDGCTMALVINTATSLAQCCSLHLVKQDYDGKSFR